MVNISILSLILFVASGLLFFTSILLLSFYFHFEFQNKKFRKNKLIILDELILIHSNEMIDAQFQTTELEN